VRDLLKGRIQPRIDTYYLLTRDQLDQIAETGLIKTLDITIASTLFGVLISLAIWLLTIGSDTPIQLGAASELTKVTVEQKTFLERLWNALWSS
jgi:hypothetical protein